VIKRHRQKERTRIRIEPTWLIDDRVHACEIAITRARRRIAQQQQAVASGISPAYASVRRLLFSSHCFTHSFVLQIKSDATKMAHDDNDDDDDGSSKVRRKRFGAVLVR
jgi:hypothetical protein